MSLAAVSRSRSSGLLIRVPTLTTPFPRYRRGRQSPESPSEKATVLDRPSVTSRLGARPLVREDPRRPVRLGLDAGAETPVIAIEVRLARAGIGRTEEAVDPPAVRRGVDRLLEVDERVEVEVYRVIDRRLIEIGKELRLRTPSAPVHRLVRSLGTGQAHRIEGCRDAEGITVADGVIGMQGQADLLEIVDAPRTPVRIARGQDRREHGRGQDQDHRDDDQGFDQREPARWPFHRESPGIASRPGRRDPHLGPRVSRGRV